MMNFYRFLALTVCLFLQASVALEDTALPCPSLFQFYSHPTDCNKFYRCFWGSPHIFTCPSGTHWNQQLLTCDYRESAGCTDMVVDTAPLGTWDDHNSNLLGKDESEYVVGVRKRPFSSDFVEPVKTQQAALENVAEMVKDNTGRYDAGDETDKDVHSGFIQMEIDFPDSPDSKDLAKKEEKVEKEKSSSGGYVQKEINYSDFFGAAGGSESPSQPASTDGGFFQAEVDFDSVMGGKPKEAQDSVNSPAAGDRYQQREVVYEDTYDGNLPNYLLESLVQWSAAPYPAIFVTKSPWERRNYQKFRTGVNARERTTHHDQPSLATFIREKWSKN